MPIDLINEQPMSIAVARRQYIPSIDHRPISPATAYRWIHKGVLAGDGTRIRLEAAKVGRSFMTTKEAVDRFLNQLVRHSQDEIEQDPGLKEETRARLLAEGLLKGGGDV